MLKNKSAQKYVYFRGPSALEIISEWSAWLSLQRNAFRFRMKYDASPIQPLDKDLWKRFGNTIFIILLFLTGLLHDQLFNWVGSADCYRWKNDGVRHDRVSEWFYARNAFLNSGSPRIVRKTSKNFRLRRAFEYL